MRMGFGLPIRGRNWGWNLGFGPLSVRQKVLYSMEYSGIAFYKRMALFQRKFWNFAETPRRRTWEISLPYRTAAAPSCWVQRRLSSAGTTFMTTTTSAAGQSWSVQHGTEPRAPREQCGRYARALIRFWVFVPNMVI